MHGIWLLDRRTGETVSHDAIGVLGRSATLPGTLTPEGDIVQLTFLNQIDPNNFGVNIDRGERSQQVLEWSGLLG